MNISAGQDVSTDRRTKAEISPKSAADDSISHESNAARSSMVAARLRFGRYVLDLERGCLEADGREIALRRKTFEFLCYLAAHPARLISKDELLAALWPKVIVSDDSVVQCVTELRRALGDDDQRLIKTVQRRGYRFEAVIVPEAQAFPAQVAAGAAMGGDVENIEPPSRFAAVGPRGTAALFVCAACMLAFISAVLFTGGWWPGFTERGGAPPPLSIAVLPFKSLSDEPDHDYFAEGVSSDLSTELSRLAGWFVIAHATARTFKGKEIDSRQVGRELNVRYLLGGDVRREADHVRVNIQLISADTGAALWAERFDGYYGELSGWYDEVIGRTAVALNYRLTAVESERGLRENRGPPEALDLTMRAWALVYAAKKPDQYFAARALFRQALELDRNAVNALAGLAWTSAVIVLDGWSVSPEEDIAAAEAAVTRTLTLDSNHVVAHHVRGFLLRMQRRTSAAHDAFRTAIGINPNFAPSHAQLGAVELELGRPEAAIPPVERAMRLSPRDPALGPWMAFIGMAKLHVGLYEDAVLWLARAIETGTPIARHHAYLASALALAGRISEARTALAQFRQAAPSATISRLRAQARSTDAKFIVQQERFFDGLRLAGLPD